MSRRRWTRWSINMRPSECFGGERGFAGMSLSGLRRGNTEDEHPNGTPTRLHASLDGSSSVTRHSRMATPRRTRPPKVARKPQVNRSGHAGTSKSEFLASALSNPFQRNANGTVERVIPVKKIRKRRSIDRRISVWGRGIARGTRPSPIPRPRHGARHPVRSRRTPGSSAGPSTIRGRGPRGCLRSRPASSDR